MTRRYRYPISLATSPKPKPHLRQSHQGVETDLEHKQANRKPPPPPKNQQEAQNHHSLSPTAPIILLPHPFSNPSSRTLLPRGYTSSLQKQLIQLNCPGWRPRRRKLVSSLGSNSCSDHRRREHLPELRQLQSCHLRATATTARPRSRPSSSACPPGARGAPVASPARSFPSPTVRIACVPPRP